MHKILGIIFFSGIILASCNEAKFDRYPGTKLDSIPVQFRGIFKDPDPKNKKNNEIVVGSNYWMESNGKEKVFLSDSNIISTYKGEFFYSMQNQNSYWEVTYLKPSGKDIYLYALIYDAKQAASKNSILKYFAPVLDKDSNYVFTMNEEKLLQYSRRELLKDTPMKLKRK